MSTFDERVKEVVAAEIRDVHQLFQPSQAPDLDSVKRDLKSLKSNLLALRNEVHSNCAALETFISQSDEAASEDESQSKARKFFEFIKRVITQLGDRDGDNDFDLSDVRDMVETAADEIGDITRDVIQTGINFIQTERIKWDIDRMYDKIIHDESRDEAYQQDTRDTLHTIYDEVRQIGPQRATTMSGAVLAKLGELEAQIQDIRRCLRQAANDYVNPE